jgi:hypothetical protein
MEALKTLREMQKLIENGVIDPDKEPIRYDPATDKHNGERLRRGDVVTDSAGTRFIIDRNSGFVLELYEHDGVHITNRAKSVSVDPFGAFKHTDLLRTGENIYS